MAVNFSSVDLKLYYDANTAVNISIFTLLVLPPFLLCLLCLLTLFMAKEINGKIRLLLINIFSAEILNWLVFFILYLGWPARFRDNEHISCKVSISLHGITGLSRFASTSIYAVSVYMFIKHGDKKLKWYVIIPYIVVTWTMITTTMSVPPYLQDYDAVNRNGFCRANGVSVSYIVHVTILTVGALFFLSTELIYSILTVIYMKRNVLEGNTSLKKAVTKVLGYMVIVSVLSFINSVLPYLFGTITSQAVSIASENQTLTNDITIDYVARVFPNITAFPTPIVTIILLKPVRDAIKNFCKKVCPCWPKHQVHPVSTEEHPATGKSLATATNKEDSKTSGNPVDTAHPNPAIAEIDMHGYTNPDTNETHDQVTTEDEACTATTQHIPVTKDKYS